MEEASAPDMPEFITYLFSPKPKFDCYFVVGKKNEGKTERIGVVKLMLMAHSEVMRLELEDSKIAEKGDVHVEDIYPDTFRLLLQYVYGYDTTAELCFEDAGSMLYAAEKYMMTRLKNKVALRLMNLLNPENICSLLTNPVCYTHFQSNSTITKILQFDTRRVLASPEFLEASVNVFQLILEQECLAAEEIELWRAAIKWAKHRAGSDDGKYLRQEVSKVGKHLRLCTLNLNDFFHDVVPSGVLTNDEVVSLGLSISKKEKSDDIVAFSNDVVPRKILSRAYIIYRPIYIK